MYMVKNLNTSLYACHTGRQKIADHAAAAIVGRPTVPLQPC